MKVIVKDAEEFLRNHTSKQTNEISAVGYGEWSQAFFYKEEKVQKIIRFSDTDEDFLRDQFAHTYSSQRLPIPEIEEIGNVFDGFFAISKHVEGEMIDTLESEPMRMLVPKLLNLFEAMRSTDTSKSKGFGPWDTNGNGLKNSWKEYISEPGIDVPTMRIHGWKEKLVRRTHEHDIFNQAYKQLVSMIAFCPEERHIIHSDLLHFNVLVKDREIAAVLDWGCAKYGDFLYDVAWFIFWQFYYPSMKGIDFKEETRHHFSNHGADVSHYEERLKCYQLHIGIEALMYCSFKENWQNAEMVAQRLAEVLE
ncbi:MAG: phosphotransferase [bacterium]|nr:phosphotransferase [bacterium]